jgi:hypothetical protein
MLRVSAIACAVLVAGTALGRADDFQVSYAAGSRDESGRFAGGTEMRLLTPHGGRLYASDGYWEDRPGPEGPQGAQTLVLDAPGGRWWVDHAFEEHLPNGRWRPCGRSVDRNVRDYCRILMIFWEHDLPNR